MKRVAGVALLWCALSGAAAAAQEADAGFELRVTASGQGAGSTLSEAAPRNGSPMTAGGRLVAYPTFKFSSHWAATAALQVYSRPYFFSDLSVDRYRAKGTVLQATLNYTRVSDKGMLMVRVGQLSTAFGSFLLRYDDAENPLVNMPVEYGYYYTPVSTAGVAGAQVDASHGRWDGRAQFANSSPANPRSLFAHDQYGNWAGGGGYTIRQGLRVGVSGYRGPYLDRHYAYYFPGEANPNTLPANGLGLDAEWSHGHWTVRGELQKFRMTYKLIPDFTERAGYVEARYGLGARWYVAGRNGYTSSRAAGNQQTFETTAGFRPNRFQIVKLGYEMDHSSDGTVNHTAALQVVTTLRWSAAAK